MAVRCWTSQVGTVPQCGGSMETVMDDHRRSSGRSYASRVAPPRRRSLLRVLGAALAVTLVLAGCVDDEPDRQSFGAWLPEWKQTRTLEPTLEEAEIG